MTDVRKSFPSYEDCLARAFACMEKADELSTTEIATAWATAGGAWATLAVALRDHRSYP